MLTKEQLKKLEKVIRQRFLALQWEMFGERALTVSEIKELKQVGLLRPTVRNFTGDAYTLGKIAGLMDRSVAAGLTYEQAMKQASKLLPGLTKVEIAAIDWASEHAGQYITGLSDDMVKEVRAATARSSGAAIRAVQDEVADAIRNRKTISELKTALFDAIDNREKDWTRVAFTEMNESIQRGVAHEIRDSSPLGGDQLVFKRPAPDACKHCNRAYLESDGTPKVFKISELSETNIGRKAIDWEPTIGSIHPWCQCQLHVIPEGFSFVKEEGGESVLRYTGETAKPTVRKSLTYSDTDHEHEGDCLCGY